MTRLFDLLTSIWLGVTLMVLIFVYSSIGSAVVPVREAFEKTEMEWFSWWPFNGLIALFTLNIIMVTLRRIPLRVTTLGVWMIHTGIVILAAGSVVYFGTKIEGMAPVYRRDVVVRLGDVSDRMPAMPGSRMTLTGPGGPLEVAVADSAPEWPVPGSAATAYRTTLAVRTPAMAFLTHQVAGHPDLTEHFIPAQRKVMITPPGAKIATPLAAFVDSQASIPGTAGPYLCRIDQIQPDWPLLSGADRGKTTESIMVSVQSPTATFTRQLLVGYPEYTEDILPGQGRAVKVTGEKLVDPLLSMTLVDGPRRALTPADLPADLHIALELAPQHHVHLNETAAILVRDAGDPDWTQRPIEGLPHYRDRVSDPGRVWRADAEAMTARPLALPAAAGSGDPIPDLNIRITDYLRYAEMRENWVDTSPTPFPVMQVRFSSPDGREQIVDLLAFDPARRGLGDRVVFRWADSPATYQALHDNLMADAADAELLITVPDSSAPHRIAIPTPSAAATDRPFEDIPGSPFAVRFHRSMDHFDTEHGEVSVAIVEIRTPEGMITRWVAQDPTRSRDQVAGGGPTRFSPPDPRIDIAYRPANRLPAQVTLVAGAGDTGLHAYTRNVDGMDHATLRKDEPTTIAPGVDLTIQQVFANGRLERRPYIVPLAARTRAVGNLLSMVQVTLSQGDWTDRVWLPFNKYVFPNERYAVPGRLLRYEPVAVTLPGGRDIELMYSRERLQLPFPVALEEFVLLTHQGGLIGTSNVRDYVSKLRFQQPDGTWSDPRAMSLNKPAEYEGLWFFQSEWDPPSRSYAGMNYTGCGIGNRNGVHIQLAGTCIAVLGMLYTFYVKPYIIRRRRLRVYAGLDEQRTAANPPAGSNGETPIPSQPIAAEMAGKELDS